MSRQSLEQLLDHWENDPAFRSEAQRDPKAAAQRIGVELEDEDWETLRSCGIDLELPDEELQQRIQACGF